LYQSRIPHILKLSQRCAEIMPVTPSGRYLKVAKAIRVRRLRLKVRVGRWAAVIDGTDTPCGQKQLKAR
jgi:hypothetical protein